MRRGGELLACQNGVQPNRVVRLRLDAAGAGIESWSPIDAAGPEVAEPTHGVLVGDLFYYIANSGWDRMNDDGTVRAGVGFEPPVIRRARVGR